ncbi:hypothetical protein BDP27DRAFT_1428524 [Rhodocollybia butyracea]|uniref:CCHC-type domain-containing protein n=1 Tax=Rhodocollybia butyracea TaxID=206335 RepID=A0A9P5PAA3_9AGAR|nr:hypothetical protein BDP27DRAFT_1428524 [Rhodocollybia butyracea]
MEYEWILTELRLNEGKLLERHPETNNYMWKWFADELYCYAKLANIENGCSSIIAVRDALPSALRVKVSDEQANWKNFTDAIKAVKKQEIEEGVERQRMVDKTKEEVASAHKRLWERVPPVPETLSKALGRSFAGMGFENTFRGGGYRGYGSGSRGGRGGGQGSRQRNNAPLEPDQQAILVRNASLLPHHPNTSEGLQAYRSQLAAWALKWGQEAVIDHDKPVPLKPGTAPVASGKCFNCGLKGHQGRFCEATGDQILGIHEREWRVLCGRNLPRVMGSFGRSAQVNHVMDNEFELWLSGEGLDQNASCIFLANEDEVIDIFSIESDVSRASVPKFVTIELQGKDNRRLRVDAALVDGGAMVSAMDKGLFEKVKNQITGWEPSVRRLCMANGVIVPATAQWREKVLLQGEEVEGFLQVFDSGGGWDVLLGKPLLKAFGAVHDFADDSVVVRKRVSEVFQKGLGKQVSICEVEDDDEKLADIRVQIPPEEKARTSDGGSERSQTPRFRDIYLSMEMTQVSKLKKEKHECLWEEERERHEEDRVLRRIAENIVQRRKDEYKTKRKEEDIWGAERLERQKEKAEEETKQNVDKERRTAREFWKTHGAKWRFRFTCRKGAFTPVRAQKGIPMHMSAEKRRR